MCRRVQCFKIVASTAIATLTRVAWAAAVLTAAPAMAAELPMAAKAPWQPPAPQAYDWTALYVGGHLGYAGGRSNWRSPPDLASSFSLFQSSDIFNGSGSYFGGLQIGYDYMLPNRVVLGAQLDASFPGFPNIDGISIGGFSIFSAPASGLASYSETVLHSGTLRGRLGYAPGNWLFYATGGFAWTYNQLALTQLTDGSFDAPFLWRLGWTAGSGPVTSAGGASAPIGGGPSLGGDFDLACRVEACVAGSPETIGRYLERFEGERMPNYFVGAFQWGDLTHREALHSLELFASVAMRRDNRA